MSEKNCQYIKTCAVYQDNKEISDIPLTIYRNVFCTRGLRGWNNCKQFIENQKESINKEE